jgi:hypothetical protein
MMFNESGRPNCAFRESNYVQLVRDVKKGQELSVYYGNSREMVKIRKQQGYTISHDPNTTTKPKEVGTPDQRVGNWRHWMGIVLLMKKHKTEDIIQDNKMIHITETAYNKQPGNGVLVTFLPPVKKGVIYQIINMKFGVFLRSPTVYHFTEAWPLGGKSKTFHDYLTVKPGMRKGKSSNVIEITTWYDAKALDKKEFKNGDHAVEGAGEQWSTLKILTPPSNALRRTVKMVWDNPKIDKGRLKAGADMTITTTFDPKFSPYITTPFGVAAVEGKEDVEEDVKEDDDELTEEQQHRLQEAEYLHRVKGYSKKEAEQMARLSHPDGFTRDEIEVIRKKLSGFDGIDKRIQALEVKYKQAQSYGVSPGEALADIHAEVVKSQKKRMELFGERMVRGEAIQSELYRRNMGPQARLAYKPGTHVAPHLPEGLGDLVAGFMGSVPEQLWARSDSDSSGVSHVSSTEEPVEAAVLAPLPEPSLSRHSSSDSMGSLRFSMSPSVFDDEPVPKPRRSFAVDGNRIFPGLFANHFKKN